MRKKISALAAGFITVLVPNQHNESSINPSADGVDHHISLRAINGISTNFNSRLEGLGVNGSICIKGIKGIDKDDLVLDIGCDKPVLAASLQKLVTAAMYYEASKSLDINSESGERFHVFLRSDKFLEIRGEMTMLVSEDLENLAKTMLDKGITNVAGIVFDNSFFPNGEFEVPGVKTSSASLSHAMITPLVLNFNRLVKGKSYIDSREVSNCVDGQVDKQEVEYDMHSRKKRSGEVSDVLKSYNKKLNKKMKRRFLTSGSVNANPCVNKAHELFVTRALAKYSGGRISVGGGKLDKDSDLKYHRHIGTFHQKLNAKKDVKNLLRYSNNLLGTVMWLRAAMWRLGIDRMPTLKEAQGELSRYAKSKFGISSAFIDGSGMSASQDGGLKNEEKTFFSHNEIFRIIKYYRDNGLSDTIPGKKISGSGAKGDLYAKTGSVNNAYVISGIYDNFFVSLSLTRTLENYHPSLKVERNLVMNDILSFMDRLDDKTMAFLGQRYFVE